MTYRLLGLVLALAFALAPASASPTPDVAAGTMTVTDGVIVRVGRWETDVTRSVIVLAASVPGAGTLLEIASCTDALCRVERALAPASALIVDGSHATLRFSSLVTGEVDLVFEAEPLGEGGPPGSWSCSMGGGPRTTPRIFARTTGVVSGLAPASSGIAVADVTGHAGAMNAGPSRECGAILHDAVAGYYSGIPKLSFL
jgi:hypothetical protein